MAKQKNCAKDKMFSDLRRKAVLLLKDRPADQQNLNVEEFDSLLHELEVYQIELAMQNEELQKEHALADELKNKYFDLYDFAPVGYVTLNEKSLVAEANITASMLLGVERKIIINQGFTRFISPDYQDVFYLHRVQAIETGDKQSFELKLVKKDGTSFDAQLNIVPMKDSDDNFSQLRISITNISQLKQTEENLRQSQKMESVGTLAGGVAHEFNNILGGIIGYTEIAKEDASKDSSVLESLDEIINLSFRARDVVKQILSFSRKGKKDQKPLQPHLVIKQSLKVLRATIPTTVEIRSSLDENSGTILADLTQIHQVCMNLCMNAAHAMEDKGGILEIGLAPVVIDAEDTKMSPDLKTGEYVKITVSDTGSGISPENIANIFDPFFTTKEVGKGTGLGLSVVHGIIKDHGGEITVSSKIGEGTTFTVLLPRTEKEIKEKKDAGQLHAGTESILLVDDEEQLLFPTKNNLERLGYKVTAMTNSLETLKLFKKDPQRYDLIITDLTMPHLTGDRLALEVTTIRPDMPVIIATGYSDAVDNDKVKQSGIKAFIPKPYQTQELTKTIRMILNEKR